MLESPYQVRNGGAFQKNEGFLNALKHKLLTFNGHKVQHGKTCCCLVSIMSGYVIKLIHNLIYTAGISQNEHFRNEFPTK